MKEETLFQILDAHYGMEKPALSFLREGGGHTYIVSGRQSVFSKS